MIAFASSVTKSDVYGRCAEPGIARAAEHDSEVVAAPATGPIASSYNALLDRFAGRDDLEAVVLLHQDTEIVDVDFCARVRDALSDPDVGVAGCVGAIDVRSIAWWEGSVTLSSFANRYEEHGGGDLPGFSWDWGDAPPYAHVGEVDTVDGFLLALPPWTIRNVRFDEELSDFHGYDLDFCLQVREAGRKVVTADLRALHHRGIEMLPEREDWIEAHMRLAEKWDGRMPGVGWAPGTWEQRARRAEAERDAARTIAYTKRLERDARLLQVERALDEARGSISWRLTAPLRLLTRR
jgi:Glycosyltransferase like family